MKLFKVFAVINPALLLLLVISGVCPSTAFAKQGSDLLESAKHLPADINANTLCRMSPVKRDDFSNDGEKQAYDHIVANFPKEKVPTWLGPSGMRLLLPELGETYEKQLKLLNAKTNVDPKYIELAIAVALRETNNREQWLNRKPERDKLLGPTIEDVLRNNKDAASLEPKEALLINFGRQIFREQFVSSSTFAEMERAFGRRDTVALTLFICYYAADAVMIRAYDQRMAIASNCGEQYIGCIDEKNAQDTWSIAGVAPHNSPSQYQTVGQSLAQLPADVHPETLSRITRTKREDFKTDEEQQAYDRVVTYSTKQKTATWLGPTGTRLQIPEVAEAYNQQIKYLHSRSGLSERDAELAITVATRESNNQEEFLDHEPERLKLLGPKIDEIVRKNQSTEGLSPNDALMIQYGRELFRQPVVSSKTYAEMQKAFGPKNTLAITLYMAYYLSNGILVNRVYDQRLDINPKCSGYDTGCIDPNHPTPW